MSTTDLFSLEGRTAIITGGSRGLGREMALAFAEHGADIVVASRKIENCEVVANEVRALGRRALAIGYHAASWDDAGRLAETAIAEFGHIDILVNNAGMSPLYSSLVDVSDHMQPFRRKLTNFPRYLGYGDTQTDEFGKFLLVDKSRQYGPLQERL